MYNYSDYRNALERLGWIEDKTDLWKIKRDEREDIFMDFRENPEGLSFSYDEDKQLISEDTVEEWSEVALFRRLQENLRKGVPIYRQQLEK
ncbi:MAG TPA: hypothetical protein DSN98_03525 [Thermoplasmata archaeon]|jgi:hypothetical protein|nr:MAG TPA: hypothetical protein DSN98_03525 [Thermoplasmata archaeon]